MNVTGCRRFRCRGVGAGGLLLIAWWLGMGHLPLQAGESASSPATAAPAETPRPLQPLLSAARPGEVVRLEPGVYQGPAVIHVPLTLDGGGRATVDGGGKGTVITLAADDVTVRNLRVRGSGHLPNDLDSCINITGQRGRVLDNQLEECLFGVNIQQSDGNRVEGNAITGQDLPMGVRGDGIRLWYANHNHIARNRVRQVRDMVMWYANHNTFEGNEASGGRYSLHLMYAHDNHLRNNRFVGNAVGIFLMYSDGSIVEGNLIRDADGASGLCLGMKEVSRSEFRRNRFIYCSSGIYLDHSPFQPDTVNIFEENEIAFNGAGVTFHFTLADNHFRRNRFLGNMVPVMVESRGHARFSHWEGNYWDTYEGFDRDGDGRGDTPFEHFLYADKLWMDAPNVKFFYGSPVMAVLDFLEQLAPFSTPVKVLSDPRPLFQPPVWGALPAGEGVKGVEKEERDG